MPKIRFLETRTVQDGTGTTYEAGKVYDLRPASANRWLRRGVAERVSDRAHEAEPLVTTRTGDVKPGTKAEAEARRRAEAEAREKTEREAREKEAAEKAKAEAERQAAAPARQPVHSPRR